MSNYLREITGLFVTIDESSGSDSHVDLVVVACNDYADLFVTKGFESVAECYEYARMIAKALNLPDDAVDGDTSEVPTLRRIK